VLLIGGYPVSGVVEAVAIAKRAFSAPTWVELVANRFASGIVATYHPPENAGLVTHSPLTEDPDDPLLYCS